MTCRLRGVVVFWLVFIFLSIVNAAADVFRPRHFFYFFPITWASQFPSTATITLTLLAQPFSHLIDLATPERPCMDTVRSMLGMFCLSLGYSFLSRPNLRVLGTADSVTKFSLSINWCLYSENQFDERGQDWVVQKFGLRWLRRLDAIDEEPPFLLFTQKDKKRL